MYIFLIILLIAIVVKNIFVNPKSNRVASWLSIILIVIGFAGLIWTVREPAIIIFSIGLIPLFSLVLLVLGIVGISKIYRSSNIINK